MNPIKLDDGFVAMYWPTTGDVACTRPRKDELIVNKQNTSTVKSKKAIKTNRVIFVRTRNKMYKAHHVAFMCMYNDPTWKLPAGYEVHHIDKDPTNNRWNNLELLTASEHRKRHGKAS